MSENSQQQAPPQLLDATGQEGGALRGADGYRPEHLDRLERVAKNLDTLDKLAQRLEYTNIAEYVRLSQNTRRVMLMNFFSGVARGLGFTVGTTIVLAIAYKVLSHIISMNIPYLTELLQDLVHMVQGGR